METVWFNWNLYLNGKLCVTLEVVRNDQIVFYNKSFNSLSLKPKKYNTDTLKTQTKHNVNIR